VNARPRHEGPIGIVGQRVCWHKPAGNAQDSTRGEGEE